ncbi:MAG: 1,4-dihydroxy-2-naphthoate octaprenyltransferase [Chloroflexi bacterium RBG_16_57_8]|nr:MAG: 1,4-dihydroxy-2-naphthoate octaprenyltransferase [Chloroflexi bacterium RBG_16_57_8]
MRKTVGAWYRASRPFTLSAAMAPVLVGSSLAFRDGQISPVILVMVLVASLLVQVTANLVDEYSDHARPEGKDKFLAPHKVIALGVLSGKAVKRGAMLCASIASVVGLYLVIATGWPLLIICLLSLAAAYFYSGGPRPLGNIGLGHPLVFVFMGPVMVAGSYYVQTHAFAAGALWLSIPVACSVTAILVANDLRDMEEDKAAGKTTPVTRWGRGFGRWEWTVLVSVAYAVPVALLAAGKFNPLVLLPFATLPLGIKTLLAVWRGRRREDFMPALRATSRLHGYFGLLLAVGVGAGYFGII